MYIKQPVTKDIKTGSIIKEVENKKYYMVLSPPCDLVKHNGKIKTSSILLCKIINYNIVFQEFTDCKRSKTQNKKIKKFLKEIIIDKIFNFINIIFKFKIPIELFLI